MSDTAVMQRGHRDGSGREACALRLFVPRSSLRQLLLSAFASVTLSCSVGAGGTFSRSHPGPETPSSLDFMTSASHSNVGLYGGAKADVPALAGWPSLSLGAETQLASRTQETYDWSQWRATGSAGVTRMPGYTQSFVGYEAFLLGGVTQYLTPAGKLRRRMFPGLEFGVPLRLAAERPRWRADDLAAVQFYLVPRVNYVFLGGARYELSAGLSVRLRLWSTIFL